MIELSNTQRSVLEQAAVNPTTCIRNFMRHLPSGAQTKVIESLVKKGCVAPTTDTAEHALYVMTPAGSAAIGHAPEEPTVETALSAEATEHTPTAEATTPPERQSKKAMLLNMLRQGTTISAIMQATSWQKHTVHGSISNLKKTLGFTLTTDSTEGGERVYRIA